MPAISDPGAVIVSAAVAAGIQVVPVPGPCAAVAALAAAGLPTDSFYFAGFLPPKSGKRQAALQQVWPSNKGLCRAICVCVDPANSSLRKAAHKCKVQLCRMTLQHVALCCAMYC